MKRLTLLIVATLLAAAAWGQTVTGSISGTVTDPNGAVVPGAKVEARHGPTARVYPTQTTGAGLYLFPTLPPGPYTIQVEQPGFKRLVRAGIEVLVGLRQTVDIQLEVGEVLQSVEVTAEAPLLETTEAQRGQNFSPKFMDNLPLFTGGIRNPETFVNYMPGVNVGAETSIQGSGGRGKEIQIDGGSMIIPESGGTVFTFPAAEMFGEFKMITGSYSAEYGRFGGGVEIFITKSGTNSIHGSGFWNLRRDVLNAAGWQSNQVPGRTPGFRAKERYNEGGVAAGGPVYIPKVYDGRNRTFWYFTYSKDMRPAQIAYTVSTIPTVLQKQGIFTEAGVPVIYDPATTTSVGGVNTRQPFPGNTIARSRWSKVSSNLVGLIPDANGPGITNNYSYVNTTTLRDYWVSAKIDHSFSAGNRLSFFYATENQPTDASLQLPGPLGVGMQNSWNPDHYRWNHDFSIRPTMLLHTMFGFSRSQQKWDNPLQKGYGSKLGLPLTGKSDATPRVMFLGADGYQNYAPQDGKVADGGQFNWTYHFDQMLSYVRGKHEYKLGWDLRRLRTFGNDYAYTNGQYFFSRSQTADPSRITLTGNAFASLLLGAVDNATQRALPITLGSVRYGYHAVFFQDNCKLTPRLTLNFGVRYEVPINWHEVNGNYSQVDLTVPNPQANGLPGALMFAGSGAGRTGQKRFYPTDWSGIAPRLGFAYRLGNRTTFRGGWGIYYQTLGNGGCGCMLGFDGYVTYPSDGLNPVLNWDNGGIQPPPGFKPPPFLDPSYANFNDVDHMGPNFGKAPRIYTWSATLQHEYRNYLFEAAYVGNRGRGLNATLELNQLPVSYLSLGSLLQRRITDPEVVARGYKKPYANFPDNMTLAQSLRPYPQFYSVADRNSGAGRTWYDSLQTKVERRFGSTQLMAAYTFSKSLAMLHYRQIFSQWNVSAQDAYNLKDMKSYLPFDQTHVFNFLWSTDLPFGKGRKFLHSAGRAVNAVIGGWTASAVQKYYSGALIQVTTPGNPLNGVIFSRLTKANVTGNPIRTGINRTDLDPNNPNTRWFNSGANSPFAPASSFTLGNAATYYGDFRNPPIFIENFSIAKEFQIWESVKFRYRADFLNVFNRTNFGGVNGTIGNANFGRPTSPQDSPRVITMGLRLDF